MVISLLQIIQYGSVVEVCQVGHILAFLVLRRVDLAYQVLLEVFGLASWKIDGHQIALGGLDLSLQEAFLLIGHPACLLAIVRLALVDSLLFERYEQVWGWVGVFALLFDWLRHFGGLTRLWG